MAPNELEALKALVKSVGEHPTRNDSERTITEAEEQGYIKAVSYGVGFTTYKISRLGLEVTNLDPEDVYL